MSVLSVAVKHLVALGMTGDALVAAIAEMEAEIDTRSTAAKRQARYRDRNKASQTVTGDVGVTPPPALDKETSPRPPKEINPTPRVGIALTRKAAGFGPPENVEVPLWNEFCSQRKKALGPTAYAAIVSTLTEAAQVGWPPGEVIARSLASGWETVFVPKERRNGSDRQAGNAGTQRVDGFTAALRQVADRETTHPHAGYG